MAKTSSGITLFSDKISGSTRRVTTVLDHLEIDYQFKHLDIFKGEQMEPWFLEMNPNHFVPVMKDGDVTLWDAATINIYISDTYDSSLLAKSGPERYETIKWMFWAAEHLRPNVVTFFMENFAKRWQKQEPDQEALTRAHKQIAPWLEILDNHLSTRQWIVGDHLTLADLDVAGPFSQMLRTKAPYYDYPNVKKWHERMLAEVPAWRKTRDELEVRVTELNKDFGSTLEVLSA
ncbi:glutathione S-transferase family protein [Pseudomonas sp. SDO528_S397]